MSIDKEFKFLSKKLLSEIREPISRTWHPGSEIRGPGSEIRDPEKTYPESGSMGQKSTRSRIPGSVSATLLLTCVYTTEPKVSRQQTMGTFRQ
jgi:hypothetical protein